ncbi:2-hydroxyacid dehydrogenase [Aneurinibacillus tyrosinisolvens]|uniref:2-hydroxyacid dehydrogenase n=1 Tax=Aneurinibacillus tyrosinisolvens TaxID=1443435 RepID=UPI00063FB66C|nr:D-glycerate dehydrogenase [Aneurinibacillus tyrosinisolvens]
MKHNVIVYKKIPEEILDLIKETCNVTYYEREEDLSSPHFFEKLKGTDGLLGSGLKINKELLEQAPRLKIVCNASVGYDNFDIAEMTKRGIMATNTPDVLTDTTADTVFGLLLASARRISELHNYVREGKWNKMIEEERFGVDVHHKVLGIIGMGRIGTAVAKRAHCGFDMKILYHNRTRNKEAEEKYMATYSSLDELLKQSDFVCLLTPLSPETKGLIGSREFNLMKKSAVFINASRGGTVDEHALIEALKNRVILAAGLDVYEKEPIHPDNELLQLDRVVTLPHIGSATGETRFKMAMLASENLVQGLNEERPSCLLNPEAWQKKF